MGLATLKSEEGQKNSLRRQTTLRTLRTLQLSKPSVPSSWPFGFFGGGSGHSQVRTKSEEKTTLRILKTFRPFQVLQALEGGVDAHHGRPRFLQFSILSHPNIFLAVK